MTVVWHVDEPKTSHKNGDTVSLCTDNAASTHHFIVPVPSGSKASTRYLVPLIYFSMRANFLSSSSSGSLTRVVSKSTPFRMYGRAHLHRKINFAMIVWNARASLLLNLRTVSLTSKIWFAAGVMDLP